MSEQNPEFDPSDHTVAEVKDYVEDNPEQAQTVLQAEKDRGDDARVTLVSALEDKAGASGDPNHVVKDPNKGYAHVAGKPATGSDGDFGQS